MLHAWRAGHEYELMSDKLYTCRYGFMAYLSRSGSTLLSRLLNETDDVCVTLEANLPVELFGVRQYRIPVFRNAELLAQYLDLIYQGSRLSTWEIARNEILDTISSTEYPIDGANLVRKLLCLYREKHKPNSEIVIYKGSPIMPWDLPRVFEIFSDFFALHVLRDPRGVYNSQRHSIDPYRQRHFADSPVKTAVHWYKAVHATSKIGSSRLLEVRYEMLVESEYPTKARVLDFLGVSPHTQETDSEFTARLPQEEQHIHRLVDQAPEPSRIDAWQSQLPMIEIRWLEAYLGRLMTLKGYELTTRPSRSRQVRCRVETFAYILRTQFLRFGRAMLRIAGRDPHYFKKIRTLFPGRKND